MKEIDFNNMPKATPWQMLRAKLVQRRPEIADRAWAAMNLWLDSNPDVRKLNSRKRTKACANQLILIIKAIDNGF